jgi:subtilisin family serine protease
MAPVKAKYIILRSTHGTTRDPFRGSFSLLSLAQPLANGLSVEVRETDRSEIADLTSKADVHAIAPLVPMKLIAPLDVQGAVEPASQEEITWGVKALGADTSHFTGDGIVVAVLDTGIDASHPAFSGVQIIQQDFTGEGAGDKNGHGTHCAGTILGRTTNGTRIGVAPGVKKLLIGKVLGASGGGSSDQIVQAIEWALNNGANVISMSLGIDFPGLEKQLEDSGLPPELATSRALEAYRTTVQLFERLASLVRVQSPTIIVAAAGNESRTNQNPDFKIGVSPPAVVEGIVSVAAVGQGGHGLEIAFFSNRGANVAAPGVAIVSAKAGGGLATMSGTSMATPHVAGVAALWAEKSKSYGPLSAQLITNHLLGTATTDGLQGFDPSDMGAGLVKAPQT